MSSPETLSFGCPHCQTRLTVPASLAGVTGPCPACRSSITAPAAPAPAAALPREPGQAAAGPEVPTLVEVTPVPHPEGTRIRPEPRRRKEGGAGTPISPRRTTGDERLRRIPAPVSPSPNRRIPRFTGAAVFCTAAGVTVYLLFYFFGPGRDPRGDRAAELAADPAPQATAPAEAPAAVLVKPAIPPPGARPDPAPKVRDTDAAPDESPLSRAGAVLQQFLTARDAASRVDLVEPSASAGELATTLLNGPLPEVAHIVPDSPRQNPAEEATDFPFRVSFFLENGRNADYAVLVRQRGSQPPKVFLPAFLDLAGGRLAAFAKEPNESDPRRFHVILDPLSVCHDESVPAADRKITFKLLPSMFGRELARAHVSSASRFARMVGDPNSSLRWGVRMRATISIQWNRKEDPAKPYLELMDIHSLNWEP